MDMVILDVYLIMRHRPLPALIPVAGNYSTRPVSSYVADMLDRKEINALDCRTKALYVSSRRNYRSELIAPRRCRIDTSSIQSTLH